MTTPSTEIVDDMAADEVKVWCLLIDHEKKAITRDAFSIETPPITTVEELTGAVKEKRPVLKDVVPATLTVWGSEIDFADLDELDTDAFNEKLKSAFSSGKKVKRRGPKQEVGELTDLSLLIEIPGQKDAKILEEARDTLSELPAIISPSQAISKFKGFKETLSIKNFEGIREAQKLLYNGRLTGQYEHPVALFHKELALLQRRLQVKLDSQVKSGCDWPDWSITTADQQESEEELPSGLLENACILFQKLGICYESEEKHLEAIKSVFERVIGLNDMVLQKPSEPEKDEDSKPRGKGSGNSSKGVNCADVVWGNEGGSYVIWEDSNEPGLSGDASLQAAVWYGKFVRGMKESPCRDFKFPAVLIGVMGNVLEISIAVCLEEVVLDKILHFEVLDSVHQDETIIRLALILSALESCTNKLRAEYHNFKTKKERRLKQSEEAKRSTQVEKETCYLPCPTVVCPSPNDPVESFVFTAQLSQSNKDVTVPGTEGSEVRPLFLATYQSRVVVVKFAVTYNEEAHQALQENYAPKLWLCTEVLGGVKMIVMEHVDGERLVDVPSSLPCSVFDGLEKALEIIHGKGLVFGDLRDTNVMITKGKGEEGEEAKEAKLIDFDWANKDRVGRYPAMINTKLIGSEWSDRVRGFGRMEKEHDVYALWWLISEYCDDGGYKAKKKQELMRKCSEIK